MTVTRLTGGLTPANGADPRTFPAIWNATATDIETAEADIAAIEANSWVTTARIGDAAVTASKLANTAGAVMVFAGTAARGSAIPTPAEGMVTYLADLNVLSLYNGTAWDNSLGVTGGILQVVSTTKTDTFTSTASTFTDVTGLTVSITPRSTSNKVMVIVSINGSADVAVKTSYAAIARGGTALSDSIGATAGSRGRVGAQFSNVNSFELSNLSLSFLDSPASTSAQVYSAQVRLGSAGGTLYVNRSKDDGDGATLARSSSTITVMEVAG